MPAPLSGAIPTVARWRLASLTKDPSPDQICALLDSCDRRTATGVRDFAVLTLLARLGLRAGEVAVMQLGGLDWRNSKMVVRGNGARLDYLPLPVDVGDAVASWLKSGRGNCARQRLCRDARAEAGPDQFGRVGSRARSVSPRGTTSIRRAPTAPQRRNRHVGGGIRFIRDGRLRHRSLITTALYAKSRLFAKPVAVLTDRTVADFAPQSRVAVMSGTRSAMPRSTCSGIRARVRRHRRR